jgi:hypothetical protein
MRQKQVRGSSSFLEGLDNGGTRVARVASASIQDALSELDAERLPEKIARAEAAISRRIKDMQRKLRTKTERQALDDALSSLSILKKRHFPGWNKGSLIAKTPR